MSSAPGGDGYEASPGEGWSALVARALDPSGIRGPLGEVIRLFGELGIAAYLADPVNARDQCIAVSGLFASMCAHRGILAETVDGFLLARVPLFDQEVVVCGHTAVRSLADFGREDEPREIAVDWTARQFDPGAPVPLVVALTDWRAFWRDIRTSAGATERPARRVAGRAPRRTRPAASGQRGNGPTAGWRGRRGFRCTRGPAPPASLSILQIRTHALQFA